VARLSLARCELDSVPDMLAGLYRLSWLDLRDNCITDVADISLRVGGVVRLNLAQNQLTSVAGLRRVWALEVLDISDNALAQWTTVVTLRNLPSLRELHVKGNPFTQAEGYRAQVFSAFDYRDVTLVLDGHGPTTQERREM
ncbi:L domain-like protein, partial [Coemansia reversa NRRL 1564]